MPCDVLNLEWSSSGRDREVATLICQALRRRGNRVEEGSAFNYRYLLLKHRPRLLYLADPSGARLNHEISLFAEKLGIPTVAFDAEGNYLSTLTDEMFWGHVADRRLRPELKLQWSRRSRDAVLAMAPAVRERLKVSGAVGFDRYRLYQFASKEEWRRKHGFAHERVVGFATWAFDYLFADQATAERYRARYGRETFERFRADRDLLRRLLTELIRSNPETMFLLKEHPGVADSAETEIAGLESLENVLKIKNEESIGDCINVCDVWMAYDSTTCIEAWLLGKPTLFINPSGEDFPRTEVHRGNPVLQTLDDVQTALRAARIDGDVPGFREMDEARRAVLTDTLQWTDGRNHVRAAHYIQEVLDGRHGPPPRFPARERLAARVHDLLFRGAKYLPKLPGFRRYAVARRNFDTKQLERARERAAQATASMEPVLSPEELADLERMNA